MPVDILMFAAVAALLAYKLYTVLGTRHGDERTRPNPFADTAEVIPLPTAVPAARQPDFVPADLSSLVLPGADQDGSVTAGLRDISTADAAFDPAMFLDGARHAFGLIVGAYDSGDIKTLDPLVSPKLLSDFKAGIAARGGAAPTARTPLTSARISAARLAGVMAYMTVTFETGPQDRRDVWTFARDLRSSDPNWTLIETRVA